MFQKIPKKRIKFRELKNPSIIIILIVGLLMFPFLGFAQSIVIKGTVKSSESSETMPGVNIRIKGSSQGTATDIDGNFTLEVASSSVLVFSLIGYKSQEMIVGNRNNIEIFLDLEVSNLSEVVVVGYGQRERKDITGAISQISSKEITQQVAMSPEMAMQGRMPGVFVGNPGSSPSARPEIRIRGVGTLGFNDPLYVIDGIPVIEGGASSDPGTRARDVRGPTNVLALINPNDIESISVLKDASATAIYGVRAANGVILITTKRGKEGKMQVDLTANTGVQNINQRYDLLNVQEYVDITHEAWRNRPGFLAPAPDIFLFDPNHPNYLGNSPQFSNDWINNSLVRNASIQDYNLSISGGNQYSNYSVGVGYSEQEDAVFGERFKRYSLAINSDHKVKPWLTFGETFRVIYSDNPNNSTTVKPGNAFSSFVAPWQPLFDPDDPTGFARPGQIVNNTFRANGFGSGSLTNFRAYATGLYRNERSLMRNIGSLYGEIKPFKGLRIRGTYSIDYMTNTRERFQKDVSALYSHIAGVIDPTLGNIYDRRISDNLNLVGEMLVGYTQSFKKHNIDFVFNAMDQRIFWNYLDQNIGQRSPIPNWEQRRIEEGWDPSNKNTLYSRTIAGLQGYMGRVSYNYDSKYYMDATIRRDGTSKFGPGFKWGTFPSIAGAWRISSENFMKDIYWLSDLKIRAGWGRIGNQEVRDFAFLSQVNTNLKSAFGVNTNEAPGNGIIGDAAALLNFPTPNLSWEIVTTSNIGFDSEFLDGRIRFTAEYYNRITDGILQEFPIPALVGFIGNPVLNLAKVSNRGFEFEGNLSEKIGAVNFNLGFNFTTVRNRVERLFNDIPVGGTGANRIQVGHSINSIFGYVTNGIFQTQAEVDAFRGATNDAGFMVFKGPGDVRFVDFAGAPGAGATSSQFQSLGADGVINQFDQTILGKTIPGHYYGVNMAANYKNFDISIFFRGIGDVQRISTLGLLTLSGAGPNQVRDYLNRWTPENPSATIPRAIQGDPSGNNRFSDRFVHNAGFLRLQNLQIGYTLPPTLLSRLGARTLRISATGSNLFVIAPGFPDLDPENITTPTMFMLGLNFGF
jgi:TonB-dependent starch-binding outer membrane protein SusC